MVSLSNHHHPSALYTAVNMLLILFLTLPSSKSEGFDQFHRGSGSAPKHVIAKMVLGSTPPKCINRCFSCRPCVATLVTAPPHSKLVKEIGKFSYQGEEGYYLMGWKCRCGNQFFHP